jgi:hypothetical protein
MSVQTSSVRPPLVKRDDAEVALNHKRETEPGTLRKLMIPPVSLIARAVQEHGGAVLADVGGCETILIDVDPYSINIGDVGCFSGAELGEQDFLN